MERRNQTVLDSLHGSLDTDAERKVEPLKPIDSISSGPAERPKFIEGSHGTSSKKLGVGTRGAILNDRKEGLLVARQEVDLSLLSLMAGMFHLVLY